MFMKIMTFSATENKPKPNNIIRYLGWFINLLSIFAIAAHWGGGFMATIAAILLTLLIPPLAAIFAFFAAINTWGWPWYLALMVFLWPVVFIILGVGVLGSAYLWMKHKFKPTHQNHNPEPETIDVDYEIVDEEKKP